MPHCCQTHSHHLRTQPQPTFPVEGALYLLCYAAGPKVCSARILLVSRLVARQRPLMSNTSPIGVAVSCNKHPPPHVQVKLACASVLLDEGGI